MLDFQENTPINLALADLIMAMPNARLAPGEPSNKKALRVYINGIPLMLAMDRKHACVMYVRSSDVALAKNLPLPTKTGFYKKGSSTGAGMHSALGGLREMDHQAIALYPVNTLQQAKDIFQSLTGGASHL